jgi:hypothetical protein
MQSAQMRPTVGPVRLRRRRSPAGIPQVPKVIPTELQSRRVFVLRLGPGRILVDLPVGAGEWTVASVWLSDEPWRWARASWPIDPKALRPIAPLDLCPGHVVEFANRTDTGWAAIYACVLGARDDALVGMLAVSAAEAISIASQVHAAWRHAQVEVALGQLRR